MISVCITTYNGEKYILDQLRSILSQLDLNDEILVSDDGSTDTTIDIIEKISDPRIRIFNHTKDNKFPNFSFYKISKNFEFALMHAKGDLIFLADQDDVWQPEKVKTVKLKIGDKLLLLHDCKVVNDNTEIISPSYFALNKSRIGFIHNTINSSYLGCCMAFKKELLEIALPLPTNPVPHDIWVGLIAEWKNKVVFCNDKLVLYRRHDENQSSSGSASRFSLTMKLRYRFLLISQLMSRLLLRQPRVIHEKNFTRF